jgi:dTMP kinase
MIRGRFITLEGGEGAGKSTQAGRLAAFLGEIGHEVVTTREPGGAPGAEQIRSLLVTGAADRWSPAAELLLLYAARDDHLRTTIRPALARGAWVVCDRFADSTRAYQGLVGGVDGGLIAALERAVIADTVPDLTLVFDLDAGAGLARAHGRRGSAGGEDRFERKGPEFHARLRQAFLTIAGAEPQRCVVVDAARSVDEVAAHVRHIVEERLLGEAAAAKRDPDG